MIRKLLLAALLIAICLGVMHFLIGWENFAEVGPARGGQPIKARERSGRGVVVGTAGGGTTVSVRGSGGLELSRDVEVPLPGGDKLFLPVYRLKAADQETIQDDLMRLDRVEVEFYRRDDSGYRPRAERIGSLTANEALVQVGRNAEGEPSIREDRDMDLFGVVLDYASGGQDLSLRVARIKVRSAADGLRFQTPNPAEPFVLELGGEEPMTVEGRGIEGFLPPQRDDPPADSEQPLELHVLSRPVLVRGDTRLSADGPLDYVELLSSGRGAIEMRDAVVLEGLAVSPGEPATTAAGDRLAGELVRRREKPDGAGRAESSATWMWLRLTGDPASFASAGVELTCRELRVAPSADGRPCLFTASGDPQLTQAQGHSTFRARDRIHLLRLGDWFRPIHGAFGFPGSHLGTLAQELVVFVGPSRILDEASGLSLEAAAGLRVVRAMSPVGPLWALGHGAVQVVRGELRATGDDGFTLLQSTAGQRLRLGPKRADPGHRFELREGGPRGVVAEGHGSCLVTRSSDGLTRIEIDSPVQDLQLGMTDGSLTEVGALDARIAGGALMAIDARGRACRLEHSIADGELITGTAEHIHSDDGRSFEFVGSVTPAVLRRGTDDTASATRILVHLLRGGKTLFDLRDSARVVMHGDPRGDDDGAVTDLAADRIRLVPYLLPPAVIAAHLGGRAGPAAALFASSLRSPWLVADGRVELTQRDAAGTPSAEGGGDRLLLRLPGTAGLLWGTPAEVVRLGTGGPHGAARAFRIRVSGDGAAMLLPDEAFDPVVEVTGRTEERSALRSARIACRGPVRAEDGEIRFTGPVHIREIDGDGRADPRGLDVTAQAMTLWQNAETGAIERLLARDDVHLAFREWTAAGDELELSAATARCVVRSRRGRVEVTRGDKVFAVDEMWLDYRSYAVRLWNLRQPAAAGETPDTEAPIGMARQDVRDE